mgnify:CR=1 FL=1
MELDFGVSSTLWNHSFGTMFNKNKEKEDKEKVKELMFGNAAAEKQLQSR